MSERKLACRLLASFITSLSHELGAENVKQAVALVYENPNLWIIVDRCVEEAKRINLDETFTSSVARILNIDSADNS